MPEDLVAGFVDPARRYTVLTNEHYGWAAGKAYGLPALVFYALVPFPWHLHAIAVGESDEKHEEEIEDDLASVRSWIEAGNFVLQCGNNYFMGADGHVESS